MSVGVRGRGGSGWGGGKSAPFTYFLLVTYILSYTLIGVNLQCWVNRIFAETFQINFLVRRILCSLKLDYCVLLCMREHNSTNIAVSAYTIVKLYARSHFYDDSQDDQLKFEVMWYSWLLSALNGGAESRSGVLVSTTMWLWSCAYDLVLTTLWQRRCARILHGNWFQ